MQAVFLHLPVKEVVSEEPPQRQGNAARVGIFATDIAQAGSNGHGDADTLVSKGDAPRPKCLCVIFSRRADQSFILRLAIARRSH